MLQLLIDYGVCARGRVKTIAAFTRSIGDCMLKYPKAAFIHNVCCPGTPITPLPGQTGKKKVPPYISVQTDITVADIPEDGFVLIGCDGVWDEMSTEEAVRIVGELLDRAAAIEEAGRAPVDVAAQFIDEVLKAAVVRLNKSNDKILSTITLPKLKARPVGKCEMRDRSNLHDDITVIILDFRPASKGRAHQRKAGVVSARLEAADTDEDSDDGGDQSAGFQSDGGLSATVGRCDRNRMPSSTSNRDR